jgi:adenylate cyclase
VAGLVVVVVCALLALRGAFEPVDLAWQSELFRLRYDAGLNPPRAPIVIIAYDEQSDQALSSTGGWTRATMAQVIDRLHAAGAKLIMIDRLYEGPRDGTAALAAAIMRAGSVVLAQEIVTGSTSFTNSMSLVPLEPSIAAAAKELGVVNLPPPDARDTLARYRLYNYQIQAVQDTSGQHPPSFALAGAWALGVHPRTNDLTFLINYAGPAGGTYPTYSYLNVLNGTQNLAAINGAIVLVGDELSTDKDYFATPVDSSDPQQIGGSDVMYGVELNANALNTLLQRDPLQRPGTPVQIAFTFPLAIIAAGWAVRGRLLSSMVVMVGLLVVLFVGAAAAFLAAGVWVDVSAPTLTLVLAPLAVLGVRFATEERSNREIRHLFGRYVAQAVVARILDDPDAFGLEGELREVTVLFSDIRGFTTLSEGLAPQEIVRLLTRYFSSMVEEIQQQGGTVDKYVGDAVMALFGAPNDLPDAPERAVRAALGMQHRLEELNREFKASFGLQIATGIGLHHGPAAVGVMGAPSKREYSAIGDTVNTASRLEGFTKDAGYPIIASATVVEALSPELRQQLAPVDLGAIQVKGRAASIEVFGLAPNASSRPASQPNATLEGHPSEAGIGVS